MENDDDNDSVGSLAKGWGSSLSRSFETGGRFFRGEYDQKWDVVSPMTQHVIRDRVSSPVSIRRQRSRSFNDYIDRVADESTFLIPPTIDDMAQDLGHPESESPPVPSPPKVEEEESSNPAWIASKLCLIVGLTTETSLLLLLRLS